ncbi:hypothetical protein DICVIV_13004 [Dictyocaulus viviparus]|uniref:Uncharacterized protein n=1 Tax=Dictyocaulus viviparus TaxID=29172 RepID=A0A0D8XB78_DICVI|nr:hypothetical protein DICVIV_13004 [Dictyocaulus viviparus]
MEMDKLKEAHLNLERDMGEDVFYFYVDNDKLISIMKRIIFRNAAPVLTVRPAPGVELSSKKSNEDGFVFIISKNILFLEPFFLLTQTLSSEH